MNIWFFPIIYRYFFEPTRTRYDYFKNNTNDIGYYQYENYSTIWRRLKANWYEIYSISTIWYFYDINLVSPCKEQDCPLKIGLIHAILTSHDKQCKLFVYIAGAINAHLGDIIKYNKKSFGIDTLSKYNRVKHDFDYGIFQCFWTRYRRFEDYDDILSSRYSKVFLMLIIWWLIHIIWKERRAKEFILVHELLLLREMG